MCGISGFNWADKDLIKKMTDAISHRGPDAEGYFTDKGISLGHRRLSIIDLSSKGNQPMFNDDNTLVIVFNGEIYNFKDIKKELSGKGYKFKNNTDTEVIIKGYEEYGEKICSKLDGMFAFAIWDKKKRKLFLARDRIGKKPLYYYLDNSRLIFSSEIKSILKAKVNKDIDKDVLLDILGSRFSPENKTIFKNIKKIPPGSIAVYSENSLKIKSFWQIPINKEEISSSVKKVDSLIESAVRKRLIADVPVGVLLSGGLDSSSIVAYMSRATPNIKTFSVGFDEGIDESKYARIVSEHFRTDHTEIRLSNDILGNLPKVVWHLDEPLADPASLPTYLLCKEVSKYVKVALSGEGGDELFGGYSTFNDIKSIKKIHSIPFKFRKHAVAPLTKFIADKLKYPQRQILNLGSEMLKDSQQEESYKKLFYFPFYEKEIELISGVKRANILDKFINSTNSLYDASTQFYFKEWLPNDLLMKVDKMSMAHGLEVRAPFLDKDLIEYYFKLPLKDRLNRSLFRKTVRPLLPEQINKRKKQGFSLPISPWFSDEKFVNRVMPSIIDLKKRKILNTDYISSLIKNPIVFRNDHKIWSLLNLEIWFKLYIDNTPIKKISL